MSKLQSLVEKARKRLDDKSRRKSVKVFVESLQETITIQALSAEEFFEVRGAEEYTAQKMLLYNACCELRETAKILFAEKTIGEYLEVVDILTLAEQNELTRILAQISDVLNDSACIRIVDGIEKN